MSPRRDASRRVVRFTLPRSPMPTVLLLPFNLFPFFISATQGHLTREKSSYVCSNQQLKLQPSQESVDASQQGSTYFYKPRFFNSKTIDYRFHGYTNVTLSFISYLNTIIRNYLTLNIESERIAIVLINN